MFSNIVNLAIMLLILLCWVLIIIRFIRDKYAPVKSVKAVVFDKYKANTVSKIHGTFKREHYIVVFCADDKKISFPVSEFSYGNYNIKDKGTLKYKGSQIISFK